MCTQHTRVRAHSRHTAAGANRSVSFFLYLLSPALIFLNDSALGAGRAGKAGGQEGRASREGREGGKAGKARKVEAGEQGAGKAKRGSE